MKESENPEASARTKYLVAGVVAGVAAVSAATVAYVLWRRSRLAEQAESVQHLLDRCHDQIHNIERRLGELNAASYSVS